MLNLEESLMKIEDGYQHFKNTLPFICGNLNVRLVDSVLFLPTV